jgi:hypothetical protein
MMVWRQIREKQSALEVSTPFLQSNAQFLFVHLGKRIAQNRIVPVVLSTLAKKSGLTMSQLRDAQVTLRRIRLTAAHHLLQEGWTLQEVHAWLDNKHIQSTAEALSSSINPKSYPQPRESQNDETRKITIRLDDGSKPAPDLKVGRCYHSYFESCSNSKAFPQANGRVVNDVLRSIIAARVDVEQLAEQLECCDEDNAVLRNCIELLEALQMREKRATDDH